VNPGATELATLLSIAVHIEPELLRHARLELTTGVDVGAEADLWFSPWIATRAADAIVLRPEVSARLRARLAERLATGDEAALRVWDLVARLHESSSPALLLEERLAWLSLLPGDHAAEIEEALRPAVNAVVAEGRTGVAEWFAGAWARLPDAARCTLAAWQLAHLARRGAEAGGHAPASLSLGDVHLIAARLPQVPLTVERRDEVVALGGPRGWTVAVADTTPRVLTVSWFGSGRVHSSTVRIEAGPTEIVVGAAPLVWLHAADGTVHEIGDARTGPRVFVWVHAEPAAGWDQVDLLWKLLRMAGVDARLRTSLTEESDPRLEDLFVILHPSPADPQVDQLIGGRSRFLVALGEERSELPAIRITDLTPDGIRPLVDTLSGSISPGRPAGSDDNELARPTTVQTFRPPGDRLGVRLPPLDEDLERLYEAIWSSRTLRQSDHDWACEVTIDNEHRLTVRDRVGPLSDPVSALNGTGRVVADLERLARADALRRLADDPDVGRQPVAVDVVRVADGELLPLDAPLLHAGDVIFVRLRNDTERPVHVSLIDIGAAGEVTVLTRHTPSGIRLEPGARDVLGSATPTRESRGMRVLWPAGLAPTGPRPETILVITKAEPHDPDLLAQLPGAYSIRSINFDVAPDARTVDIPEHWPSPGSIMSTEQLRDLAEAFRSQRLMCDADFVAKVVSDVAEYHAYAQAVPGPKPPPPLDELLRPMGRLLYEASWEAVQRVPAMLDAAVMNVDALGRGLAVIDDISALADAARRLPWPEYAGRALGAIRAQALAESKRDTEAGYDVAWTVHQEARRRYHDYREALSDERSLRDLDEVLLQLALAEAGTACRTAERVISRWSEDFADEGESRWLERIFGDLSAGADIGEQSIDTARQIERRYGFVDSVTEDRLALRSALQNPGIMTARASALLLALGPAMRRLGLRPGTFSTWEDREAHEIGRFTKAYRAIEAPVVLDDGEPVPIRPAVLRQLVHMRLNLALLKPGHHLPSALSFPPVLERADLDDDALTALSVWLAPSRGGPGRERGIGAAMMPAVIRSIRVCRGRGSDDRSYDRWRIKWFQLDQFSNQHGRRTRLDEALAASQ
jgi:hypothetical protein